MKNEQYQSWCVIILWGVLVVLGTVIVIPVPFFEFVLPKLLLFSLAAFSGVVAVLLRAQPRHFAPLIGTRQGRALLLFFRRFSFHCMVVCACSEFRRSFSAL